MAGLTLQYTTHTTIWSGPDASPELRETTMIASLGAERLIVVDLVAGDYQAFSRTESGDPVTVGAP